MLLRLPCVALALALVGCEAVPDLTFPEASSDAPEDRTTPRDAGHDAPRDAGHDRATADAPSEEAEASSPGCPDEPPDGAACCGVIPCIGECGKTGCSSCKDLGCSGLCCVNASSHARCVSSSKGCN